MRKTVISYMHQHQAEQAKRNQRNSQMHKRSYGRQLKCVKCGKDLKVGDVAYRTTRKFLCQTCGSNAEIDA